MDMLRSRVQEQTENESKPYLKLPESLIDKEDLLKLSPRSLVEPHKIFEENGFPI
jgi:hypothetical protein